MRFDPDRHHRRSTRLPSYDYTEPGSYFVTLCTYQRLNLFDDPTLRSIAEAAWQALPEFDPCLRLDAWVLMPNHIHGIIDIAERSSQAQSLEERRHSRVRSANPGRWLAPGSLGAIVRTYKARVTYRAHHIKNLALGPIWQRGFWERVIRDETELQAVRRFIEENPLRWSEDRDNLDALLDRMRLE